MDPGEQGQEQDHRIPGHLIEELLKQRGWTKKVLSIVLNYDESTLNKIISGKRQLDAEMALVLGEVFDVEPERFLDLQRKFDLAQARIIVKPDPKRAGRARLFGGLPVTDMIKRSWIDVDDVRDVARVEAAVLKFFRVGSVDEIEAAAAPHAAKKTDVGKAPSMLQCAWLRRVRQVAEDMLVPAFSTAKAREVAEIMQRYLSAAEEARHVPRALSEAGIRFVMVESLPGAKIDGVCTWLADDAPVIALSCRLDRIDNFWFVLRHELEHVIRGDGKLQATVDTDAEFAVKGELPSEEHAANAAAAEFCVPQAKLQQFIDRKDPYYAERDIIGFAKTQGIHPGVVAGQLQRHTERYDRFRAHQVKIRSIVAPNAVVDGWGDVAPVE